MTQAEIKRDLLDQLERSGTVGAYFIDLVNDYMALYAIKKRLQQDVKKRGSKIEKLDSRGQEQTVNNESIDQIIKANIQMLKMLDSLGIRAVRADSTGFGDDIDL